MYNAKFLTTISIICLATGFAISYGMNNKTIEKQIEERNTQVLQECLSKARAKSTPTEILREAKNCDENILTTIYSPSYSGTVKEITGTASLTPVSGVPGYTSKHSLVLTGSHSYVQYSNRVGASWKNNNSAGLTWGVSNTLKGLWDNAGIRYKKGSPRPAKEKGNYIYFETVEEGLRAKIIAIRERWGNATVEHYLYGWGTDNIKLSFDKSKIIKELTDSEFTELFIQQMKKESPGYVDQLVKDKILIIGN